MAAISAELRIGISACLFGEKVRWDGRDKRHFWIDSVIKPAAWLIPVCPEVELGLGVPRDPIRLERWADRVHLVAPSTGRDLTSAMDRYALRRIEELEALDLAGYILKANSPSCGMAGVVVHHAEGTEGSVGLGAGLFAAALRARWPDLPQVEEGQLDGRTACEAFLARARAFCHTQVR